MSGERLGDIADRYAVSVGSILRWNHLDPNRPQFWVGEQLRILTQLPDRVRHKLIYIVHPADTWQSIAQQFHVGLTALQKYWNPHEQELRAGHQLTIWVEPENLPESSPDAEPEFALKEVPQGAYSIGLPDAGRLINGVQIPENPALYTLRNLDHAYGSTHAISVLQRAIAMFRERTGYDQQIVIWDMSMPHGGRFGPHHSHRTGRDVDIGLPMRKGTQLSALARDGHDGIDWEATWHLVHSFVATGDIRYIFLNRSRQEKLYHVAKECGASQEELDRIFQYPRTARVGIVRHSPGHMGHLHVRFTCGDDEAACEEL